MGKVLVVDDDAGIRDLLRDVFTDEGHSVTLARDGVEALQVLAREGEFVVFLDLMMPRLTGEDVIRTIASRPDLRDSNRVVVMSAQDRILALGPLLHNGVISDRLAKPFDVETVLELASRLAPYHPPEPPLQATR
jgi:CheY-like chemotaxis protein